MLVGEKVKIVLDVQLARPDPDRCAVAASPDGGAASRAFLRGYDASSARQPAAGQRSCAATSSA